jgi:hypothetical protein
VPISAKVLENGIYKLTVRGLTADGGYEPVDFYRFQIEKK